MLPGVLWIPSCICFPFYSKEGEIFNNVRSIRKATTESGINKAVKDAMPPFLSQILKEEHLTHLSNEIKSLPEPPVKVSLTWNDFRQAAAIFLMVFFSTFPVTIPFIFIKDVPVAMRVSNGIALVLLFLTGVYMAKQTGRRKLLTGLGFAMIGTVLVTVTMALGG